MVAFRGLWAIIYAGGAERMLVRKGEVAERIGVAAAAALLLSAAGCSSGSVQKPAAAAGTQSSSPSASSTTSSATAPVTSATSIPSTPTSAGPTFTFPADYHLTVDPDTTGDPVKDAILADNAWFLQADQEAIASGNVNDPLLQRYAQPDSLPLWQQGVKEEHAKGTLSGTERFYNRVVLSVDTTKNPPVAALYVCDDQSKLRAAGGHVLDVFGMVKDADGTWKTLISTPAQSTQQVKQQCP